MIASVTALSPTRNSQPVRSSHSTTHTKHSSGSALDSAVEESVFTQLAAVSVSAANRSMVSLPRAPKTRLGTEEFQTDRGAVGA